MKHAKQCLSILLVLLMLCTSMPLAFSATVDSGTCGDNVTWTLDDTGTLTISGTGEMNDFSSPLNSIIINTPWKENNESINRIIINNGVTHIGRNAFCDCKNTTSIYVPKSVTSIGYSALGGTYPSLAPDLYISDMKAWCQILFDVFGPFEVGSANRLFLNNVLVQNLVIPSDVTSISSNIFNEYNYLESVTIPNSVTSIGDRAFYDCSNLTNVTIGSGLTNLGTDNFLECEKLSSITLSSNNPNYSSDAFGCLYNKDKTTLLLYPRGNIRTSFAVPSTVTTIENAFDNCSNLEAISIPAGVTSINCEFNGCSSISSFMVDSNNLYYSSDSFGCLYNKNKTTLVKYPIANSRSSFELPNTVTTVGKGSFSNCTNLTDVTIPNSVTSIDSNAFNMCTSLNTIVLGRNIKNVGLYAFCWCNADLYIEDLEAWLNIDYESYGPKFPYETAGWANHNIYLNGELLTELTLPNDTVTIKRNAFNRCKSLNSVVIPVSLTAIDSYVFYKCDNITDIYYCGTEEQWQNFTIYYGNGSLSEATIHYNYNPNPTVSHTVTYNYSANGGTSATASTATVAEGAVIDLTPTAAKSGWTFVGWNTNANATTALSSLTMNTGDVTLYAIYKKTLTGTFIDYSGTSKTTRTASATIYNKATSGTVSAPAQNTYTGWSTRGWTTGTVADASTTSSFTISANTTYYGTYQRTLTLSYNANGGSSTPSSQTGTQFANSYSISSTKNPSFTLANAISKSGSAFDGWAMGSTSGTKYAAGSSVSVSANTTMYATWKATPVNIYNLGEETYSFPNYVDADSRGGHCFGMSSTSAMYYLKRIDISRVGGTGNNLYALSDNATVRKPICYYQGQQEHALDAMVAGGTYYRTFYRYGKGQCNISSDWNEVVNYVKSHNYDDKGTLQIGYRSDGLGGHAINFLRYAVENGQERIYAYDNNFPTTETYFYKDASGRIKQAPKATFKDGSIDCICLRDMSLFRTLAGDFSNAADDSTRKIYANRDAIHVGDILAYPIDGDIEMKERVLYYLPENETQVRITPNVDNATFTYCDEEYHFGKISDETYGVLTLKSMDEQAGTDQAKFSIVNAPSDTPTQPQPDPNMCHWCGKVHEGFFQKIIGFFHNILARIFGNKY